MLLYHTGYGEIRRPDLSHGRRNADFGQGFYLSLDRAFSERWARSRKGMTTCLNTYALQTEGLRLLRFERDRSWFEYISQNRAGRADALRAYDVIVGPIANDTIYTTCGISTSGLLTADQALGMLLLGPEYVQVAVKSERALDQLQWLSAQPLEESAVAQFRETVRAEEAAYQAAVGELLGGR